MSKKLTIQEVERIAELSRIGVSYKEKGKLQEDLGSVLDYVGKLAEVDVSGVEPTAHIMGLTNQTREDENGSSQSDAQVLIDMAPETKDRYVKVRKVLTK